MKSDGRHAQTKQVTFSIDYWTVDGSFEKYETVKQVSGTSSVRTTVLQILAGLKEARPEIYLSEPATDTPLSIHLANGEAQDVDADWYAMHIFGLDYVLEEDGSLRILNLYEPLTHDWTIDEINELSDKSYIKGDPNHLLITVPEGLGAAPLLLMAWVGFINDVMGLGIIGFPVLRSVHRYFKQSQIRRIGKEWTNHGILYPEQLRTFIDSKSGWTIEEVCRVLKVERNFGYELMMALGLEPVGKDWRLTQSKNSISKRKAWIRNEKKYEKIRNENHERP